MTEENPPEFQGANCYTFEDFRQAFGSAVCLQGVVGYSDLKVTAVGGASVNVSVAAGSAWVEGSLNGSSGMYHVTNDGAVAMTIAANGAGSSRIDLIIASVYDSQYIGAADSWALEVVQGVAGAGVPAVPASTRSGYVILAEVTVPASGGTPSVVNDTARERMSTCGTFPYVRLGASAATSIPGTGTYTKVDLTTTVHIDEAFFSVSGSVVTILVDGLFDFQGGGGFTFAADSKKAFGIGLNGANTGAGVVSAQTPNEYYNSVTRISRALVAGNTLQLVAAQNSGGAQNTTDDGGLTVRKVG